MTIPSGLFLAVAVLVSTSLVKCDKRADSTTHHFKPSVDPIPASIVPQDASVITSATKPKDWGLMPEVGNGHVASQVQAYTVFMNGLYNGLKTDSHRARIPNPMGYSMDYPEPKGLQQLFTLDTGRGFFTQRYYGQGVSMTLRTYAHRVFTSIIVSELILTRDDVTMNVNVQCDPDHGSKSDDIDFTNSTDGLIKGKTRVAEYSDIAGREEFYMKNSGTLDGRISMKTGNREETYVMFSSFSVNKTQVLNELDQALASWNKGSLLSSHVEQWNKIWSSGRVDMDGDLDTARINYAAFYYLYSSLPFNGNSKTWPFIGLSPGGLAHGWNEGDYAGHVFWDQDTWMFPGLALLHADLGKLITQTRTRDRTMKSAKILAKGYGNEGLQFPWESAYTGLETCPGRQWSYYEIHISGDVSFMMRQYWQLTNDKDVFQKESGLDLVRGVSAFWASRSTYDSKNDVYHIKGVMPPDEFHYPVTDSAYTNSIAAINLRFANSLGSIFGLPVNKTWEEIANKLYIPYDKKLDYHPEFAGYQKGDQVKQADAVMLTYPMMVPMNRSTKVNDLLFYEQSTPIGPAPAMTWSIFLTNWLELGNETKAAELFKRSILNAQPPFNVWTENSDGSGAINFLTGMGGHLQSLLFGYGGCRIYDDHLTFNPKLIPTSSNVNFTGVDYRGSSFDLHYNTIDLKLTLTSEGSPGLEMKLSSSSTWNALTVGKTVSASRQAFDLRPKKVIYY